MIIFFYGASAIPMSYVFSFMADTPASGFTILTVLTVLAGVMAPVGVWILRLFGEINGTKALIIASDVVRYIFTLFPAFPLSRMIMAIVQVEGKNNLCVNGVENDTLFSMCEMFTLRPETLLQGAARPYSQCCDARFLGTEDYAVCGQNFTIGPLTIDVRSTL